MSGSPRESDKRMKNNIQLGQCQQVLPSLGCHSNLDGGNVLGVKLLEQCSGRRGGTEDEQSTGCLRIEEEVPHLRGNGIGNENTLSKKLPVARQAACAETLLAVIESAR